MNETNKTLYIPLYGKAMVSRLGIILEDKKAEQIWDREAFPLGKKSKSKWLAYYMAMRARVFDTAVTNAISAEPDAVVLHIGCGMDSRYERLGPAVRWYDIDFPAVIEEKKKYFAENSNYHLMAGDAIEAEKWIGSFQQKKAIVVMEGVSMYLTKEQMKNLVAVLQGHFEKTVLIADFYSEFAAKVSKYKNPVNDVGAAIYSGMDNPQELVINNNVHFVKEWDMTPNRLIDQLTKSEQKIFHRLYAGKFAKSLYRMFEYHLFSLCK